MCAARDVPEDSNTGFCRRCETRRTHENYLEKNAAAMDIRRQKWRERTAEQSEWDAERQRIHRLREAITPRELPDPDLDPWQLGHQILKILSALKPSLRNAAPLARLEEAMELIRQLAHGPGPIEPVQRGGRRPAPERSWGWEGSWRRSG